MVVRRRQAAQAAAGAVAVAIGQAGAALGGVPLAVPERRPAVLAGAPSGTPKAVRIVVRPGDTLWSIATRLARAGHPREVVDAMSKARHGAPLIPGETLVWPQG